MKMANDNSIFDLNCKCTAVDTVDDFLKLSNSDPNSFLNVLHLNIRSLSKHWDELEGEILPILNSLDIVILSEINIRPEQAQFYFLDDFEQFCWTREGRRGGGLMVFAKISVGMTLVRKIVSPFYEGIHLVFALGQKHTHLLALYRPPDLLIPPFIAELDHILSSIPANSSVLVIGDLNIDLSEVTSVSTALQNAMAAHGLQNCITKMTRVEIRMGRLTKSRLDLIFERGCNPNSFSAVIRRKIADHYMTALAISLPLGIVFSASKHLVLLQERKVAALLGKVDWNALLSLTEATPLYTAIREIFDNVYTASKKTVLFRSRKSKPWITKELLSRMSIRDRLFRLAKNNLLNECYSRRYKSYRNKLNRDLKAARSNYYKIQFVQYKNDMATLWKHTNRVLGREKRSIEDTVSKYFSNESKTQVVGRFSNYFHDSVSSLRHYCGQKLGGANVPYLADRSIRIPLATQTDVESIINTLKPKGPGCDGIRSKDLKLISTEIAPVVAKLINLSLSTGEIPDDLKLSCFRPTYKGGDHKMLSNYRPIAILNQLHKIMEKYVKKHLVHYLGSLKYISPCQYAYQTGKSAETCLVHFTQLIFSHLNNKKHVLVLFVDFSKAFDVLPHDKLLSLLADLGIRDKVLKWFESYLGRDFVVKLWDEFSSKLKAFGVPQGSVLGPILFLIYVNHLYSIFTDEADPFAFADDLALVVAHISLLLAQNIMQHNFNLLMKWSHDMSLVINIKKTKLMHIKSPHIPSGQITLIAHSPLCLHGPIDSSQCTCAEQIEQVEEYKYLGVKIDSRFKFDVHIDYLSARLRSCSYTLFHLRRFLDESGLKIIYTSLFEQLIRYGILAWGNTTATKIATIVNLQRRVLKSMILHRNRCSPNENPFHHFELLPADALFKNALILKYYFTGEYKHPAPHSHFTRQANQFVEPRYTNEYGRQHFSFTVPHLFNSLPEQLKTLTTYKNAKKGLKQFFLNDLT